MILSKEQQKWIFKKLIKMKSIGSSPVTEDEILGWCHSINVINSLELDETEVLPGFSTSKYKIDAAFKDMILPYQVTFKGEDLQENLLSEDYANYDKTSGTILKPETFNDVSEAILACFKKTANLTPIDTLKGTEPLESYYKREAHNGKTSSIGANSVLWYPVELSVNVKKSRFMNEDSNYVFEQWINAIFRNLKDGKTGAQGEIKE